MVKDGKAESIIEFIRSILNGLKLVDLEINLFSIHKNIVIPKSKSFELNHSIPLSWPINSAKAL